MVSTTLTIKIKPAFLRSYSTPFFHVEIPKKSLAKDKVDNANSECVAMIQTTDEERSRGKGLKLTVFLYKSPIDTISDTAMQTPESTVVTAVKFSGRRLEA